ncbi:MAG: hypothetical protein QGF59_23565 [Pirellulaceae bacterium]|nr:hypothetical protein [Pirellulaceae bacterium]MDP6721666.1 hypothetical protein [Pirellulaceae bacterium]
MNFQNRISPSVAGVERSEPPEISDLGWGLTDQSVACVPVDPSQPV